MAQNSLANLNVRLGFVFDQKSLTRVERQLRTTGDRLARTGSNISLFISAPLALLGSGAIKAAGEFESLRLAMEATFKNAGRTVEEARAEVEALRKAALAPGLDFQQAVSASIRLQSVGLSAENARNTIQELANAIASTGGTADNLSSVTVQMAQMISKGKVLSQDLRIIQENLPIISDLMLKAFGTANAEKIQELGITGKDFVKGITAEMTKLTRVQGGIANALVNAGSAIKQALAGIGDEIARVLNIGALSDKFAAGLHFIVEGFKGLSDGTKKAIVYIGLFLAALGPITLLLSGAASVLSTLVGVYRSAISPISQFIAGYKAVSNAVSIATAQEVLATKALESAKAATVVATAVQVEAVGAKKAAAAAAAVLAAAETEAAAAARLLAAQQQVAAANIAASENVFVRASAAIVGGFKAMNLAAKAFILIGIAAAVYAIASSLGAFGDGLSGVERAQISVNKVMSDAESSIAGEKAQVLAMIGVLEDERVTRQGKIEVLNELKGINEKYFGQLKVEKGEVIGLTAAYDAYIANLLAGARVKAGTDKMVALEEERKALIASQDAAKKRDESLRKSSLGILRDSETALSTYEVKLKENELAQSLVNDAIEENIRIQAEGSAAITNNTKKTIDNTGSKGDQSKAVKDIAKAEQELIDKEELDLKMLREIEQAWKDEAVAAKKAIADIKAANQNFEPLAPRNQSTVGAPTTISDDQIAQFDRERAAHDQLMQDFKDSRIAAAVSIAESVGSVFAAFSDKQRDKELADLETSGAAALAAAQGNATLQAAIQADLDAKRAAIEKKAARRQKLFAIGEAIINTAVAVTKAIASAPPPFNIPAIIAASVAGAAQIAIIAAHAKGTKDAPGGLSLVGEKGAELVNLPRHSQVFPAHQTSSMLKDVGVGQQINLIPSLEYSASGFRIMLNKEDRRYSRTNGGG